MKNKHNNNILNNIDVTCLIHGKKMSEHTCLYCCLCFKTLTPDQCNTLDNGEKEDVCISCAKREKIAAEERALAINEKIIQEQRRKQF